MYENKDKEKIKLDHTNVIKAYYAIKEICHECTGNCDYCRVGDVREDLVELEDYMCAILGE